MSIIRYIVNLLESQELSESVTFSVARLEDDPEYGKMYNPSHFQKEETVDCWACDGTGKEYDYECGLCHGSGKIKEYKTDFKELNVSNTNLVLILEMLGMKFTDDDYCGAWQHNELPELKRKLIKLKNQDVEKFTRDTTDERGKRKVTKDENGLDKITTGPRVVTFGVDKERIDYYIDTLLKMVDYAQKHDACVVWN